MKILAVETSTQYLCVSLGDGKKDYALRLETGRRLSAMLLPVIGQCLQAAGWRPQDIDVFGCGIGPGSFTAVRIGMAAVKALAWSMRKPVVGVNSLELIAANAAAVPSAQQQCKARAVIPVVDAKRSLVYAAAYAPGKAAMAQLCRPQLVSVDDFIEKIYKKHAGSRKECILVGDGIPLVAAGSIALRAERSDKDFWYPQPQHLSACVRQKIAAGRCADAKTIEPLYLYPAECQVRTA